MTLKEAAIKILEEARQPLEVSEILARIKKNSLFTFQTSEQRSVLQACLKRHSLNSHSCTPAKKKAFQEVGNGRFSLLENQSP